MEDRTWRRYDLRWSDAGDRYTVLVDLLRQSLGEALDRSLLRPVAGATAQRRRVRIWTAARPDRRARRDIDDASRAARDHIAEGELTEDERRVHVDCPRAQPAVDRIVGDREEVGEGSVVHEDVDGTIDGVCRLEQLLTLGRLRDVDCHWRRLATGRPNLRDRTLKRSFQLMVSFAESSRGADDLSSLDGERPSDLRANPTARTRDDDDFTV